MKLNSRMISLIFYIVEIFTKVLNSHLPTKQKLVRGNHQPFMNKTLSKAFMHRSKLKNLYNKFPTELNETNYKKATKFMYEFVKEGKNEIQ